LLRTTCYIRLIGHDQQQEAACFQLRQCSRNIRQDFQLLDTAGRIRFAIANHSPIQDAIPVQENGLQRTDSHLVSARLMSG